MEEEGYHELRAEFLKCHENHTNTLVHVITSMLGVTGALCLLRANSNKRITLVKLAVFLYAVALVSSSAPLPIALVVIATLAVLVPLVPAADLGIRGSTAAIIIGYLGQDAAHYFTGEATFQSTYSNESVLSVEAAAAWTANFCRHTFFLLPLTVDAAARTLLAPGSAARSFLEGEDGSAFSPPPAWLVSLRDNAWVLAALPLWVAGCYALDSDSGMFPWMTVKQRVLRVNLVAAGLRRDLAAIRRWAAGHGPSRDTTTHWWFADLAGGRDGEAGAFSRVAECSEIESMFREKFSSDTYAVESIPGMNEVYVSGPAKSGSSDAVFTTRHTDGPFALLPFCSTYRCILGLDSSAVYTTVFPNVPKLTTTCRTGDIVCFDYNREVHYIEGYPKAKEEQARLAPADGGDGYRIVLKLHYCVYPRFLWPLGKLAAALSAGYNALFRSLFLFTLEPSGVSSHVMAFLVVRVTALYRTAIEAGLQNLLYVAALFAAGRLVHPVVFLAGTSFVHYPRYITTYYHRGSDLDFGRFKMDALFFKAVALSHVACRYVPALLATMRSRLGEESDVGSESGGGGYNAATTALVAMSLAMIIAGSTVSTLASRALGMDGTYFGPELGVCEMKWVSAFPYNFVPHPMIVGQLVAFAGVHLLPEFRAAWPWLMPAHCTLYLLVMAQEHWDWHAKSSESGRVAGYVGGKGGGVTTTTKKLQ